MSKDSDQGLIQDLETGVRRLNFTEVEHGLGSIRKREDKQSVLDHLYGNEGTLLHISCGAVALKGKETCSTSEMVGLLLEHNAEPNSINRTGMTPLYKLLFSTRKVYSNEPAQEKVIEEFQSSVRLLLDAKALIEPKGDKAKSISELAAKGDDLLGNFILTGLGLPSESEQVELSGLSKHEE